jgi:hypothetical protein
MRTDRSEYRARVTDDDGLTRGKVPSPLLRAIGARPGDDMIFSRTGQGTVVMRISRVKTKLGKGIRKKTSGAKRR